MPVKKGQKIKTLAQGRKTGSGRPKKSLEDKILEGRKYNITESSKVAVDKFTLAEFSPEVIKNELNAWLLSKGCLEFVDAITIEKYAETVSIWKIATERVKEQGYTIFNDRGVKIVNPNWKVSSEALKQSNELWADIKRTVEANMANQPKQLSKLEELML